MNSLILFYNIKRVRLILLLCFKSLLYLECIWVKTKRLRPSCVFSQMISQVPHHHILKKKIASLFFTFETQPFLQPMNVQLFGSNFGLKSFLNCHLLSP